MLDSIHKRRKILILDLQLTVAYRGSETYSYDWEVIRARTSSSPREPSSSRAPVPDSGAAPHLEPVPLPLGDVLYESGDQLQYVYFPSPPSSLTYVMATARRRKWPWSVMKASSVSLFMGGETMPNRAVVQSAGHAYRLKGRCSRRSTPGATAFIAAVHPGAADADVSDGGVNHSVDQQSPLAAVDLTAYLLTS
jgi:hypothetical protein